ncbi:MAG: RHS repeat-associated core domain-containing protein, partial [Terriglobales bacterium]
GAQQSVWQANTLTQFDFDSFTGKPRDNSTGFDYFGARYYGSALGRFLTPDPAGLAAVDPGNPQSWNRYAYALNNPVTNTDPTGLLAVVPQGCVGTPNADPTTGDYYMCPDDGDPLPPFQQPWGTDDGGGGGGGGQQAAPQKPGPPKVPRDPCTQEGGAPSPSWYVAQAQGAGQVLPPGTGIDSGSIVFNRAAQFFSFLNFRRGASLDAQPLGASAAYGNYVFGASLSAAGYPLWLALSAANAYAFLSGASYPGQVMDTRFSTIPAANVANIANGYNAQQSGTLCHP